MGLFPEMGCCDCPYHPPPLLPEALRRAQGILSLSKALPRDPGAVGRVKANKKTSSDWLLAGKKRPRSSFDILLINDFPQNIEKMFLVHIISRETAENPIYPNNPAQHLPGLLYNGSRSQSRESPCSPTYNRLRSVP